MSEESQPEPKPKLRWYQYRLWHLFVLTAVIAVVCSWFACKMVAANKRKAAVNAIEALGGSVTYDYQLDASGGEIPNAKPPGPEWFRNLVGLDFLADVVCVRIGSYSDWHSDRSYQLVTDDWIQEHIMRLTNLQSLGLHDTQVTDAGLEHLKRLPNLRELHLTLSVYDTYLTVEGVEKLQQALPNCEIEYSTWSYMLFDDNSALPDH